jgi:hypothetical protein
MKKIVVNSEKGEFTYSLPQVIEAGSHIFFESACFPNTFFNVTSQNRTFQIMHNMATHTLQLTRGFYDVDQLVSGLHTLLSAFYIGLNTWYHAETNTIEFDQDIHFLLSGRPNFARLAGLEPRDYITRESTYPIDLCTVKYIILCIDQFPLTGLYEQIGEVMCVQSGSIAHIPLNSYRFQIQAYQSQYPTRVETIYSVNQLHISIRDQNNNLLEGVQNMTFVLCVEEKEKAKL